MGANVADYPESGGVPFFMTGRRVAWKFTRTDGSTFTCGSWIVPKDVDYVGLEMSDTDFAWTAMHALARQDPLPIVSAELILVNEELEGC